MNKPANKLGEEELFLALENYLPCIYIPYTVTACLFLCMSFSANNSLSKSGPQKRLVGDDLIAVFNCNCEYLAFLYDSSDRAVSSVAHAESYSDSLVSHMTRQAAHFRYVISSWREGWQQSVASQAFSFICPSVRQILLVSLTSPH